MGAQICGCADVQGVEVETEEGLAGGLGSDPKYANASLGCCASAGVEETSVESAGKDPLAGAPRVKRKRKAKEKKGQGKGASAEQAEAAEAGQATSPETVNDAAAPEAISVRAISKTSAKPDLSIQMDKVSDRARSPLGTPVSGKAGSSTPRSPSPMVSARSSVTPREIRRLPNMVSDQLEPRAAARRQNVDELRRLVEQTKEVKGPQSPVAIDAMEVLAFELGSQGCFAEQIEILNEVSKTLEAKLGPNDPDLAEVFVECAMAYGNLGGNAGILKKQEILGRAYSIQVKAFGKDSANVARTQVRLANAHGDLGDTRSKVEMLQQASKTLEKHLGADHIEFAATLTNLGNAYMTLGNTVEHVSCAERSLDIKTRSLGEDHPDLVVTLTSLAFAYARQHKLDLQEKTLVKALHITNNEFGLDNWRAAGIMDQLGGLYMRLGLSNQALPLLQRALALKEKTYGPSNVQVAITLANLGFAHGELGMITEKADMLTRAEAILEKCLGPTHPQTLRIKKMMSDMDSTVMAVLALVDPILDAPMWCSAVVPSAGMLVTPRFATVESARGVDVKARQAIAKDLSTCMEELGTPGALDTGMPSKQDAGTPSTSIGTRTPDPTPDSE